MKPLELRVLRDVRSAEVTLGQLFVDGEKFCETLEDPVREISGLSVEQWKIKGETAIPRGKYRVIIDFSPRFQRPMLHLLNVPGFAGIRVHGANFAKDVEGCIGVGEERIGQHGIRRCARVLARLEARVAEALAAGRDVWMEVDG